MAIATYNIDVQDIVGVINLKYDELMSLPSLPLHYKPVRVVMEQEKLTLSEFAKKYVDSPCAVRDSRFIRDKGCNFDGTVIGYTAGTILVSFPDKNNVTQEDYLKVSGINFVSKCTHFYSCLIETIYVLPKGLHWAYAWKEIGDFLQFAKDWALLWENMEYAFWYKAWLTMWEDIGKYRLETAERWAYIEID
jgi:hypothetical protein